MICTQVHGTESRLIVGAIHAKTENSAKKWDKLAEQLHTAKKAYTGPQLWYVDINMDVAYTKTQQFLAQLRMEGWTAATHTGWTHFNPSGKHSNIDLILHRGFTEKPTVKFLGFDKRLSDHRPIKVTVNMNTQSKPVSDARYVDKKALYEHNVKLLQAILDSTGPQSLIQTFEEFSEMELPKRKFTATSVHKRIKDLDLTAHGVWRPDAIRKACADNFNDWYNSNVKDKTRQQFDRAFHVTAQRAAAYKKKGCMLDLLDGPIIGEEAHRQLLTDPTLVETVPVVSTPEEIQDLQMLYQR